ncbi:hypothetical protein DFP92_12216 [Yoonia sediminilitoris]|uniref:Uncharacterized protein n=1 Tax=Yoonia sediminilitoris TaxID=1286148 RepID=A0A2T6K5X7_9RHOB|nr:hypothetical protein C8N45_12216 [Yoonia sediminilitoris]RCW89660.1 hypothetical protein DFP92_12216 [Yoonia sediminilitoris]
MTENRNPPAWYLMLLSRFLADHGHSQRDVNAYILQHLMTQSKFTKIKKDT